MKDEHYTYLREALDRYQNERHLYVTRGTPRSFMDNAARILADRVAAVLGDQDYEDE